ncbi:MAG: glutamine ABC transporter permease, partial [Mycobacterium sp.]|nr:glutamine ABC transporter permease [Mycobacterium sp.]
MLIAALRDLQWRKRRFVIAIVGTGLVFAMTLVLTGLANGFGVEANRTVDALGLQNYLVKSGA